MGSSGFNRRKLGWAHLTPERGLSCLTFLSAAIPNRRAVSEGTQSQRPTSIDSMVAVSRPAQLGYRLRCCLVTFSALVVASHFVSAAERTAPSNPPGRAATAPVTNALPNFQIKRGFRIDLVADSSLVSSPVAMAFDENGRLFVAEMRDYPDRRNESPHLGRIRLLEDTDGDGAFDASTVYADDIP